MVSSFKMLFQWAVKSAAALGDTNAGYTADI